MSLAKSSLVNYSFGKIACKWGQIWVARVPWQVLPYCSGFYCSCLWQSHSNFDMFQWWIQGECQGGPDPQTSLSDLTLVWDWKFYIDRIVYHFLTGWYLLIKHALHFATKLNSRDIKKCNCFWVPFYDLFTSACKAVFPAPCNYCKSGFTDWETRGQTIMATTWLITSFYGVEGVEEK